MGMGPGLNQQLSTLNNTAHSTASLMILPPPVTTGRELGSSPAKFYNGTHGLGSAPHSPLPPNMHRPTSASYGASSPQRVNHLATLAGRSTMMRFKLKNIKGASLAGRSSDVELKIKDVNKGITIGAEAAAATAVVVGETSAPVEDAVFAATSPFYFAIRDRDTGLILFFGRVMNPAE